MDKAELKNFLFNINHLCTHIAHSRNEVRKLTFEEHKFIIVDVERLLSLLICSLLDELKEFDKFVKSQDNYYLQDTYYVLVPLIDYLKSFDSLRIKRNKVLAHHNRTLQKNFAPWWKELIGKKFAITNEEESMMFSVVKSIHQIFVKRFDKEIKEVIEEYDREIDVYEKYVNEITIVDDAFADIQPTILEVQKRMREKEFTFLLVSNEPK